MNPFKKKPSPELKQALESTQVKVPAAVTTTSELDLLKKQLADQEQIIRELVTTVTWIANHKRFEHIQEKLIIIHNLLDKMTKL